MSASTVPAWRDFSAEVEALAPSRVLPVLTLESAAQTAAVIAQLAHDGISGIEVTMRTPFAPEAMALCVEAGLTVAAGTVRTPSDVAVARDAGACALVSPGLTRVLADAAAATGLAFIPGVATPSEISVAWELGLRVLKLFPAERLGGIRMLAALHGPFPDIRFIPTGGLNSHNVGDYLAQPNVLAVGGSWMVRGASA